MLGGVGLDCLMEVLRNVMETEQMPDEWQNSTLIPIFKNKGDIQEYGNY